MLLKVAISTLLHTCNNFNVIVSNNFNLIILQLTISTLLLVTISTLYIDALPTELFNWNHWSIKILSESGYEIKRIYKSVNIAKYRVLPAISKQSAHNSCITGIILATIKF